MSIYAKYNYPFQRELDILYYKYEIESEKLNDELYFETFYFQESENDEKSNPSVKRSSGKIMSIITRICESVSRLITDIIEMFSNIFTKKKDLDIDTYIKSNTGSIELDTDLQQVQQQVNAEVRQGRKLIQAISKGTKINDETVEKYVDKATEGIHKHGKTMFTSAKAYKMFQNTTGNLKFLKSEMKDALDDCKANFGQPGKEVNISKIFKAMKHWVEEGINAYRYVGYKIYEEAINQSKKKK